jgi:DNA polymerase-3 subunit beta
MKFSCLSENLAKGLSIVSKAVSSRGSLPVLSHVLLQTEDGRLKLGATDLETGVVTWVGGKVLEEGGLTVPARLLWELVSQLPSGKMEIASQKQVLTVRTEQPYTKSRLHGLPADEFPPFPAPKGQKLFSLTPKVLAEAVGTVAFAAARDESRPILTGVLVRGEASDLRLVGVDGFRLAEKRIVLDEPLSESVSLVIPAKTLSEVVRLGGSAEEPLTAMLLPEENQTLFSLSGAKVACRLLEGQFPDYEKIIPASFSTRAEIPVADFLKAVRLAAVFARDSASVVKMALAPDQPITFSANTQEVGEHKTTLEAKVEGEPLEIAFNSRYLTDLLSNLGDEGVIFEAGGPLNPGVFKPVSSSDYFHLIMPVRIAG